MFDNPKKELERLEQQLLAMEVSEENSESDSFPAETDDIDTIYEDLAFSSRSAGVNVRETSYTMDTARYVPVPKKKRKGGWLLIACLAVVIIFWRMGWFA